MSTHEMARLARPLALAVAIAAFITGCGGQQEPPAPASTPGAPAGTAEQTAAAPPPAETLPSGEAAAPQPLEATSATWTPEQLEELLAPVALYPDPVLTQVLMASTNPQEVLDAGNWLVANPKLEGNALDEAAEQGGFTPPILALIQFPQVVDQMCLNMNWTEELGQAYVNDQAGTLDAVQRLRVQAREAGTLQSSEQMKVETKEEDGQEVVAISPPSPQVVYVPQYDPVAAYAPPAAAPAPAQTTTTVVQEEDEGHSTGALIATGLLSFGAGMVVNEVFDDDDEDYYGSYYSPHWHAPMPYYPPYPYRPVYGGGFYPSNGYNRPNNYVRGNNVVVVNQNNNYFRRYDNDVVDRKRPARAEPDHGCEGPASRIGRIERKGCERPDARGPGAERGLERPEHVRRRAAGGAGCKGSSGQGHDPGSRRTQGAGNIRGRAGSHAAG